MFAKAAVLFAVSFVFLIFMNCSSANANYLTVVVKKTQEEIKEFNKAFESKYSNKNYNSNCTQKQTKQTRLLETNSTVNSLALHTETIKQFFNKQKSTIYNQKNKKRFTNTTVVNPLDLPTLTNNVNLLYKMGYLPFYAKKVDNTGIITWQWDAKTVPSELALLTPKSLQNILYKSAIDHFLNDMGLNTKTDISSLLESEYKNHWQSPKPFVWVLVNQKPPERLKVWQNGSWIIESNCNTGINHLTPDGNFMIYSRYKYFTMSGVFPLNDQHYFDSDVPYVNFFDGGDAIHGFPRYSYGYPQSAGCVELPVKTAKEIFPYLYVGTVVTIVN
jgi:hypothetical protein